MVKMNDDKNNIQNVIPAEHFINNCLKASVICAFVFRCLYICGGKSCVVEIKQPNIRYHLIKNITKMQREWH